MNPAQHVLSLALRVYRVVVSPALVAIFGTMGLGCRYTPTCSQYAMEAVRQPLTVGSGPRKIAAVLDATGTGQTQRNRRRCIHDRAVIYTGVRRLRPTRRRLARVARPLLVEFRFKKPCCRLRRIFEG